MLLPLTEGMGGWHKKAMAENHKRFYTITGSILAIWGLCWLILLSPSEKSILQAKKKITALVQEQGFLLDSEFSPQPEVIQEIEKQNQTISEKFQELVRLFNYKGEERKDKSVVSFWMHCKEKQIALQTKANKLGIRLDENLGIPHAMPSAGFHDGYWTALEVGGQILSLLLELDGQEQQIKSTPKLTYLLLQNPIPAATAFVNEFPVEVCVETKVNFISKLIYYCSHPAKTATLSAPYFLKVNQLQLEQSAEKTDGIVRAKIILAALRIIPDGVVQPTSMPEESATPANKRIIPIWERY